ncbi:hypothetical protein M446_6200 [Methylobacterium sp. 4-46]|uniref:hypothetical protein n=1 Tax=unclassified Methylobacterium TaxID=2615210 RepID=UPI000152E23A|nr:MULTISPECIES: hypothetical protein [Methylobacterium]ACA20468.1 hypothetical protein M446_6200 [Methylobacterium sp. 4-46]WFT79636.1 hypothetical protein QA634_31320 [Methylobacterium nodulans]
MRTQDAPLLEDTLELREQLAQAWRAVFDGAIARGSPPEAVVETMASVAHARFAELFGASAAATYLQLLSEQLRDIDRGETERLVNGEAPEPQAPAPEAGLDGDWPGGLELI